MLSYAERIISSRKCIFDEIFYKQVFKNFGSIGSHLKTSSG